MSKPLDATTIIIPSPTGGWNSRDPLDNMAANDAVELINMFPQNANVVMRKGNRVWQSGMGSGVVETVIGFQAGGTKKLLACSNNNIYDITTQGGTPTSLASGLSSNVWQYDGYRNRIVLVNGSDTPRQYDGTSVSNATYTAPAGYTLTPANLNHVNVFKSRLYFVEKSSSKMWYSSQPNEITGQLSQFDFQYLMKLGGSLLFTASWTRDSGDGADDLFVAVTTNGEAFLYSGSAPDQDDWSLIGRFVIGRPLGNRAYCRVGPDIVLATEYGVIPLSRALQLGTVSDATSRLSSKIDPSLTQAVANYGLGSAGWQLLYYPTSNMLILNVPISSTLSEQYVANIITGAWCRFTNLNARNWAVYDGQLIGAAGAGVAIQADYGTNDQSAAIPIDIYPAYNYCGAPGRVKQFLMAKPNIYSTGTLSLGLAAQVDFTPRLPSQVINIGNNSSESNWDDSPWDTSPWGDNTLLSKRLYQLGSIGDALSVRIRALVKDVGLSLNNSTIFFKVGGLYG